MKYTHLSILVVFLDMLLGSVALLCFFLLRFRAGFMPASTEMPLYNLIYPAGFLLIYWFLLFQLRGLYKFALAPSRFDELLRVVRSALVGCAMLGLLLMPKELVSITGGSLHINAAGWLDLLHFLRYLLLYLLLFTFLVGCGRLAILTIRRFLFVHGRGLKSVLIVGFNEQGWDIHDRVNRYPALGYRVVGFISTNPENAGKEYRDTSVIAGLEEIAFKVISLDVQEVIVAFDSAQHALLLDVITQLKDMPVGIKILPSMYDIVSGQVRINQIYGFPLITINPQILGAGELLVKRIIDITVSVLGLILFLPLFPVIALAIRLNSPGPLIYSQERVGQHGDLFRIHKFRTMRQDAETKSGPVWSQKNDPRITRIGYILRKTRLDEIPQLWNILVNEMSIVGPRPERPFFVDQFVEKFPLYRYRLKLKPGLTGWAQVKHKYDESLEDVELKLQHDLYYLENLSISLDIKIIFNTIKTVLTAKGQ
ncbi:MAG: sugar transferase [Candidatus Delongbacteria bacterium]|nr:sugar transferase [Candidatus Delongbacteria bacterium]